MPLHNLWTHLRRWAAVSTLSVLFVPSASASEPIARVVSRMVLVPFTVTDRDGKPRTGLQADDFQVFDGGERRPIHSLWREDAPAAVGIVLDLSGSMETKLPHALSALAEIIKALEAEDSVALFTFADEPRMAGDFERWPETLLGRVGRVKASGGTALYDAIYLALHKVKATGASRKALVVISDGADNASRYSLKELSSMVVEADVQIYTIGIVENTLNRDEREGSYVMEAISERSGGLHFTVTNRGELPVAAARIARVLKHVYVLAYHPPEGALTGKWRKIRVALTFRERSLRITAKPGYYQP